MLGETRWEGKASYGLSETFWRVCDDQLEYVLDRYDVKMEELRVSELQQVAALIAKAVTPRNIVRLMQIWVDLVDEPSLKVPYRYSSAKSAARFRH